MPGPKLPTPPPLARAPRTKRSSCNAQVAFEQRRITGDGVVGRVHQRVPVDLIEPDRRVAPERAARGVVDRVAELRDGRLGELELLARLVGVDEAVDHLGVEHEVLAAVARGHRVHEAGRVDLAGAGLRGHVGSAGDEPLGEPARAGVVARGALMSAQRRHRVRQQQHRVGHRVGAAATAVVVAVALVPGSVEALLHAVGERPVAGVVVRGGRERGCGGGGGRFLGGGGRGRHEGERRQRGGGRGAEDGHRGGLLGRGGECVLPDSRAGPRPHIRGATDPSPYTWIWGVAEPQRRKLASPWGFGTARRFQ